MCLVLLDCSWETLGVVGYRSGKYPHNVFKVVIQEVTTSSKPHSVSFTIPKLIFQNQWNHPLHSLWWLDTQSHHGQWKDRSYSVNLKPFIVHTITGCYKKADFISDVFDCVIYWKWQVLFLFYFREGINLCKTGIPSTVWNRMLIAERNSCTAPQKTTNICVCRFVIIIFFNTYHLIEKSLLLKQH